MALKNLRRWKFFIPIIAIIIAGTVVFMLIYASNPFMELASIAEIAMGVTVKDKPAPEFAGIVDWINTSNSQPIHLADLRGQVVLIDFWTYSCINCKRDMPYVNAWYKKYQPYGFEIVGVHTPEFRFEQQLENVKTAVKDYAIEFPVAMDNAYATWHAYHNLYWPAKYLIDANGNIVYMQFGEGGYTQFEQKIQELLQQATLIKVEKVENTSQ